jgi:Arc/MetJ family transcription regulator
MRKRTTIDLDSDLVKAAASVLGTTRTSDTVHAALSDVVRRDHRTSITDFRPTIDLADLDEMRAHRFTEDREP